MTERSTRGDRSPLWQLTLTRLRHYYRDPNTLIWGILFPIILTTLLGVAFRNNGDANLPVGILEGPGAEVFERQLTGPSLSPRRVSAQDAERELQSGAVAVIVEPGTPITYRFDLTRTESRLARALVEERLERAAGRADVLPEREVTAIANGARYIDFVVPGLIGLGLLQSGLWGIGYMLIELRGRKAMKRLVATPMKKRDFLFSFGLVRVFMFIPELPPLFLITYLLFDVHIKGSILLVAALCLVGAIAFSGLGILIASRADNFQAASGIINAVLFPSVMGSGVFFSTTRFPAEIQPVLDLLPLTTFNDALRAIMLEGAGPSETLVPFAILGGWAVVTYIVALRRFRWH